MTTPNDKAPSTVCPTCNGEKSIKYQCHDLQCRKYHYKRCPVCNGDGVAPSPIPADGPSMDSLDVHYMVRNIALGWDEGSRAEEVCVAKISAAIQTAHAAGLAKGEAEIDKLQTELGEQDAEIIVLRAHLKNSEALLDKFETWIKTWRNEGLPSAQERTLDEVIKSLSALREARGSKG